MHEATLEAERLAHVVSLAEEKCQASQQLEPSRHMGIHLDSVLLVQTKKRYVLQMPRNIEELHCMYEALTSLWQICQKKHPGRKLFENSEDTWAKFFKELLSEDNFKSTEKLGVSQ